MTAEGGAHRGRLDTCRVVRIVETSLRDQTSRQFFAHRIFRLVPNLIWVGTMRSTFNAGSRRCSNSWPRHRRLEQTRDEPSLTARAGLAGRARRRVEVEKQHAGPTYAPAN